MQYYHSSIKFEDGVTKVICGNKCQGLKVLQKIDRNRTQPELLADVLLIDPPKLT